MPARTDCAHMARAFRLAERGQYTAHPNPMVGCVITNDGEVVGEGWHQRAGEPHAEVNALAAAGSRARGATAYVTLEPCAHRGRTPPCAAALVDAGVRRVVVAMQDPFPQVAGRGLHQLESAGIAVDVGLMQASAAALNAGFISRVTRNRPCVRVKVAASIDGAVAMRSGESQWITGPESRDDVQRLRARCGAIMTGIGTVLADDPSLNVRLESLAAEARQPLRVIADSRLRMPPGARMLRLPGATLIVCASNAGAEPAAKLRDAGAEVLGCGDDTAQVDLSGVLEALAERDINDVLIEAGPRLTGGLLQNRLVDELVIYQAPHIMGSETATMFETPAWRTLADRKTLDISDIRRVGADTRITARVQY